MNCVLTYFRRLLGQYLILRRESMSNRLGPPIPVLVELSNEFAFAADTSNSVTKDFGARIKQGLDLILYQCGIPGHVELQVQVCAKAPFSQLVVHGLTISYPLES